MALDNYQIEKFSRQILVNVVGYDGQARLLSRHVEVAGPTVWRDLACRYLEAAGVLTSLAPGKGQNGAIYMHALGTSVPDAVVFLQSSDGQTMRDLGLALSRYLITLASVEGEGMK
jgi:hypothetical protein